MPEDEMHAPPDRFGRNDQPERRSFMSPSRVVLIGFMLIVGALLFTEHRAHMLGVLLYLPLLLCPLMHFFMHGWHGGHHSHESSDRNWRAS
jgi:hypothetical protein